MKCRNSQENSLETAVTNYKDFEKLGLFVIENVLTEKEESDLFLTFKKNPWDNLSHRRVQHFGYKFIYGLNNVNQKNKIGEIPQELLLPLYTENFKKKFPLPENFFDQITINEYKPGAGIPPHIDSHGPFEELLVSVSIFSDIVMCFDNPITNTTFSILLPKRSAVVLTGEIRYLWKHSIASRKIDRVENNLLFRRTRYSLTYRKTKSQPFCNCSYPNFCDFQKEKEFFKLDKEIIEQNDFEKVYVKDVYNTIAQHFSHTRYKPWPSVFNFLQSLPKYSLVGDIGCGNGKYLFSTKRVEFIGTDIAFKFVEICKEKEKNVQVAIADTTQIPFKSESLDYVISIAVIHHLSTEERRLKALQELLRVVKKNGEILVYVWALEQEKDYGGVDIFVPWNNQKVYEDEEGEKIQDKQENKEKNTVVYKRYYHLFQKGELEENLIKAAKMSGLEVEIMESQYHHQNWAVRAKKISKQFYQIGIEIYKINSRFFKRIFFLGLFFQMLQDF